MNVVFAQFADDAKQRAYGLAERPGRAPHLLGQRQRGARLLHDLARELAVLLGLPVVALLPTTPFAVIRISNEALAWPLFALALGGMVRMVVRPSSRAALVTGIAIALAAWTRMYVTRGEPIIPTGQATEYVSSLS